MSQPPPETADEMFRRLYECDDPDCTATHVNMDSLDTDEKVRWFLEDTP